ncbi:hypothetical protein PoB_001818300 [Plakobranchus ocellatus]|uniref:Uncharacterized protein n=1 Tax=Plakobranchus ocellatus TaxID=259542 RepID=A0AAV3ZAQ4_9GAST|nr:hypothetical protein PoB_001818300 [Plakobranchus ocellatus]
MTRKDFVVFKSMPNNVKNLTIGDDGQENNVEQNQAAYHNEGRTRRNLPCNSLWWCPQKDGCVSAKSKLLGDNSNCNHIGERFKCTKHSASKKTDLLTLCQSGQIPNL